jgi:hypothetical protein
MELPMLSDHLSIGLGIRRQNHFERWVVFKRRRYRSTAFTRSGVVVRPALTAGCVDSGTLESRLTDWIKLSTEGRLLK